MTIEAGTDRLHRLDDEARAALFLDARTANTFSDEPVSDEQPARRVARALGAHGGEHAAAARALRAPRRRPRAPRRA
ncbi:hypothetical protein GCM10025868_19650 [Angustibacter aerolatus]|uniref:Nitroreductase domain-containing protein n=1 Tax=Angustibacter aerolatus TaxID=1162965 RepID=A0ABQ6JEW2_9ACTN|nr:hypothetical protein [Angustibacter aerolatus]GMA86715.1 hypothetical protein GCM10025868_19650 [Angustibacter aerolatus]